MIHILTVHWRSDKWIDIQTSYLDKYIRQPYRVYAFLNDLPKDYSDRFFYSLTIPIKEHAFKLNVLAEIVKLQEESPDDILMFIDGDAFPITDLMPYIYTKLEQYPLIAIQRLENNGDIQPHPSFCATTTGFWKEIKGDWNKGHYWLNNQGKQITDVGGNLLKILQEKQIDWYPLLRSNTQSYHPVFFSIYDNIIYHHGAGFRKPTSRYDGKVYRFKENSDNYLSRLLNKIPMNKYTSWLLQSIDPARRFRKSIIDKHIKVSNIFYEKIKNNFDFYKELIDSES